MSDRDLRDIVIENTADLKHIADGIKDLKDHADKQWGRLTDAEKAITQLDEKRKAHRDSHRLWVKIGLPLLLTLFTVAFTGLIPYLLSKQ